MSNGKPEKSRVASGEVSSSIADFDPPRKPKRNKYALACSILACMTSILLGYDIGVMSGAIIYIQKDLHITDGQKAVVMGILSLYCLIGSAAAGRTSDWLGRRYTIVIAGAIFFAGAILMGLATNFAFLMVGRFVAGIGVGYAMTIAPVYTAEMAPPSDRGMLSSFPEVFINTGVLLGYVSNYAFSKLPTHIGWRIMVGIAALPSALLAISILAMPESPRWLVMHGQLKEAKKVLDKVSNTPEESKLRLEEIKEAVGIPQQCTDDDVVSIPKTHKNDGVWRDLFLRPTSAVSHVLLCAVGIHFFQMASGIEIAVLYSPTIFEKAGIISDTDKLLATIAVGVVKLSFIFVSTFMLDKIGRRTLLLFSVAGSAISLMGLACGLTIIEKADHRVNWALALCMLSLFFYVAWFAMGLGPITWVYSSEIFPLKLRAQGFSVGIATNRVTSAVIAMTFISLSDAITIGGTFFLYAGITVVGWVFFYSLYPETRGRTLEEMGSIFGTFFKWRSTMRALEEKKGEGYFGNFQMGSTTSGNS